MLSRAQADRRQRVDLATDAEVERTLDAIGLSEERCTELALDPGDRKKLKGIIARLRSKPHPFTTCMRDLRKHQPGWSEDRRKRTCNVLKQATGRGSGKKATALATDDGACAEITDGIAKLLEHADADALASLFTEEAAD